MKLPSIRQAYQDARATFGRFPVVILDAVLGTLSAIILVDHEGPAQASILFNVFFASVLGIPLLTSLVLVAERRKLSRQANLALQLVGVLLLVGYAFTIPTNYMHAPLVSLWRFLILAVALHLFASAAPYAARGEWNGFWHYNRTLFLRVLTAYLYSLVLYAGLSIALAALDNLFGVYIPGKRYFELWILVTGMFSTWFFLAGVPERLSEMEALTDYPKSLKIFAQYILLPIVLIYLVILYAYLAKIVVAWDWPQGWVSKLILGFSATGIFWLLLLHPLTMRAGNSWIGKSARWFYIALIPLIVLLFLAVWRRVGEYGITEGRYLALALGVWLAFLVAYFTVSRVKSIKMIPVSLCVLAFAVSFGPWGAFSVSRQSQVKRLERLVTEAGILVDSKVRPVHAEVPFEQAKQISAVLSYLREAHGYDEIQAWFAQSLREDTSSSGLPYKSPDAVTRMMGFEYVTHWATAAEGITNFNAGGPFDPRGYDRMAMLQIQWKGGNEVKFAGDSISYRVSTEMDSITFSALSTGRVLVGIDLLGHARSLVEKYRSQATDRVPGRDMVIEATGNGLRVRICPSWIRVQKVNGKTELSAMTGVILYSKEDAGIKSAAAADTAAISRQ